jgi:large subunit ribosomal protein L5
MARLKQHYDEVVRPALQERFGYTNPMMVPKLDKLVINMAVGKAVNDRKKLDIAVGELTKIAGQKPLVIRARKSVANFKLRQGMPIACKTTLRRERMYEFVDRLVTIAMPRIRDFRGVNPKAFDGRGNFALGLKEQIIFPEINYDEIDEVRGMDVIFCTTARTDEEARVLLEGFDVPFMR